MRPPAAAWLLLFALLAFSCTVRAGTFSVSAWTGDASTNIGTRTIWAQHYGSIATATVNGVSVTGVTGAPVSTAQVDISGPNSVLNNDTNNLTTLGGSGSGLIAQNFIFNGNPAMVTLKGLTAGLSYTVSFLSVGWEASGRVQTFTSGGDSRTVDQDQFGDNNGIRIDYTFTASGSTQTITVTPQAASTFHFYAIALQSALVTLISSDGAGTSSFAAAGQWNDGSAPSSGNAYATGASTLRTATGTGSQTFAGSSLTIDSGGSLSIQGSGTITANNLSLNGGSITNGLASGVATLQGSGMTVAANSTLDGGGSGKTLLIQSAIGGSAGLSIQSSGSTGGVVQFTAANTYSGATTISNGATLNLSGAGNANNSDITAVSGSNLTFTATDSRSFTKAITGTANNISFNVAGNTSDSGGGDATSFGMSNTGAFTGTVVVNSGLVSASSNAAFGNTANVIQLNAASGQSAGLMGNGLTLASTRAIQLTQAGGNSVFRAFGGSNFQIDGQISGAGNLVKTDGGTLILTGANTFTGTTRVGGGVLQINNALALQNSTLNTSGPGVVTLSSVTTPTLGGLTGSTNLASAITTGYSGVTSLTLNSGTGVSNTYSGVVANGAAGMSLVKTGAGTQVLSGANTYSGGTTLTAGTLQAGNNSALGTGTVTLNGGTLGIDGQTLTNNLVANASTTSSVVFGSSGGALSGALTGTGTVNFSASSIATILPTLPNVSSFSGTVGIDTSPAGTSFFPQLNSNGAGAKFAVNGGGTGNGLGSGSFLYTSLSGSNTLSLGELSGNGRISGNNDGTSTTTWSIGALNTSSTFSGVIFNNYFGNAVAAVTKVGTGTLTLSGTNTYSGATTVSAGTLTLNNVAGYKTTALSAASGATLSILMPGNATSAAAAGSDPTAIAFNSVNAAITGAGVVTLGTTAGAHVYAGASAGAMTTNLSAGGVLDVQSGQWQWGYARGSAATNNGSLNLASGTAYRSSDTAFQFDALTGSGTIGNAFNAGAVTLTLGVQGTTNNATYGVSSNTATFSGVIASGESYNGVTTSALNLVKTGSGTQILSGANTYTGTTTISSGVLNIQSANALGTTAAGTSVTSGAALQIQGTITTAAEALTLNGTGISATGALRNISGTNNYAGLVTLGSATRINSDAGNLTLSNTGTITGAGLGLTVGGAGNTTINSIIGTGSGTLTKDGAGTLTLTRANTFTGNVTVSAGTLEIGGSGSILQSSNASTVSVASGATILISTNAYNVLGWGLIPGGGENWVVAGTINSTSTFAQTIPTGGITLNGGTLTSNFSDATYGSYFVNSDSGIITANGTGNLIGGVSVGIGDTSVRLSTPLVGDALTVSATLRVGGLTTPNGGLTKSGLGTVTLTGANTYNSTTTISAGTLNIQSANALGTTAAGTSVTSGAALQIQGGITTADEALTLNGTGVSTDGALRNISGTNSYAGLVALGSATRINSDSGTLTLSNTGTITGANRALTVGGAGNTTIASIIGTTTGTLTKDGAGTLTLSGVNTYTGTTTISAGTLALSVGGRLADTTAVNLSGATGILDISAINTTVEAIGSLAGVASSSVVLGTKNLQVGDANNTSFAGAISGTGALIKVGAGKLTLSGTNTYSGSSQATQVRVGTLEVATGGSISHSSSGLLVGFSGSSGTLNISGGSVSNSSGTLGGDTNSTGTANVSAGTWTNSGNLSVGVNGTGVINLTGGTVHVGGVAGTGTVTLGSSGTLNLGTGGTVGTLNAATVTSSSGTAVVNSNHTGSLTFAPNLTGSLAMNKLGTGTTTLTGTNTYTGATTVSAGTLTLSGGGSLSDSTAVNLSGATGIFDLSGITAAGETIGSLTGVASSSVVLGAKTLTAGGDDSSTAFAGVLSGTNGGLTKTGTGTLTLSALNTYTGATTLSAGTLSVTGSIASSSLTINGGTLMGTGTVGAIQLNSTGAVNLGTGTLSTGNIAITDGQLVFNVGSTSSYGSLSTTGAVNLTNGGSGAQLVLNAINGYTAQVGDTFTLITNDLTDAISGNFAGLTEGQRISNVLGSSLAGQITYVGGSGNDVVLMVVSPNTAPTLAAISKSGTEDTTVTFAAADFTGTYNDPESTALSSITVATLPATGTLKLSGTDVTASQVIPTANLGNLTYVPAAHENGAKTFTVTASDGSLSSTPATTVTMTLTAVNDAPSFAVAAGVTSPAGTTWTARDSNRGWQAVASSSDGTKLAAAVNGGLIYTSTDSGETWTAQSSSGSRGWVSIASSSDGAKLAATVGGGGIYTSTDSGVTWTLQSGAGSRNWGGIASSADGTKLVAGGYFINIYTSTDSGVTWTARASARQWAYATSSADGTKLAVVEGGGGPVWTSTDSGVNWVSRSGTAGNLSPIAGSADGTTLVTAAAQNGTIYTSTNSGSTWTSRASQLTWNALAASADGTKLFAAVQNGQVYTSTDSGVNWTAQSGGGNRNWNGLACSSDGSKLVGVVGSGQIYTSAASTAPYAVTVAEDAGAQTIANAATSISPGPADESAQTVSFTVTNTNNTLFSTQPAISASGTLTFTSAANANGSATVSVTAVDTGGTANGGVDTSATQTFTLTVTPVNDTPTDIALSASALAENVSANSTVGTLSTTDVDLADTFTYTLVSGTGSTDNAAFNISGAALRLTASPNFEFKNSYSVRVRSTDAGTLFFEKPFTITITNVIEAPVIASATSANLAPTTATLGGNVTSDGGLAVTERGVVYALTATNSNPQIGGTGVTKVAGTGTTGVFTVDVSGLSASTGYSYAAYVTNADATSYTSVGTFTTTATFVPGTGVTVTYSAVIGGTTPVAITGGGTLALTNANTYTAPTNVQSGTVAINTVATGTTAQSLGAGNTVNLGVASTSSGSLVYTGGAGTLDKTINALGNGGDTVQNSGTGLLTLSGTLNKTGTTLTLQGGANGITVSGTITGDTGSPNSDLIVDGGTVTLASANTYNGPTYIINGGTLNANAVDALPTSVARTAIIMDQTGTGSSTLSLGVSQSALSLTGASTSAINLNANTLTTGTTSGSTTFAGVVSGTGGGLTKEGASTQILTGANTYTGATTVSAGTLTLNNVAGYKTTALSAASGATLSILMPGNATSAWAAVFDPSANAFNSVNAALTGAGLVTLGTTSGAHVVAGGLSGAMTTNMSAGGMLDVQSGQWQWGFAHGSAATNNGSLNLASGAAYRSSDVAFQFDALTGSGTLGNAFNNSAVTLTLGVQGTTNNAAYGVSSNTATFSGVIASGESYNDVTTSALNLVKTGSGTQILSGANTYTGTMTISGGTLQIGAGSTTGSLSTSSSITNNATLAFNRSNTITQGTDFASVISGSGAVTQAGTGTLVLSGTNTYTGATTINSGGTLQIGAGSTTGSLSASSTITNNGTLTFNRSNTVTQGTDFASVISGSGAVTQAGTGTLVLNGANTYSGTTTVSGGTLNLSGAGNSNNSDIVMSGGSNLVFTVTDTRDFSKAITGTAGTLTFNVAGNTSDSGASNGTNFALFNTGSFTGTTVVNTGLVSFSSNTAFGNTANVIQLNAASGQSAGLLVGGNASLPSTRAIQLTTAGGNSIFRAFTGATLQIDGVISGAGNLVKTDGGNVLLTGANTFTGSTRVGGGELQINNALALQNSTFDTTGSSLLRLIGVTTPTFGGLSGSTNLASKIFGYTSGVTSLTINPGTGVSNTYSGVVADGAAGMSLVKTGAGTQIFSGANTYTGTTTVSAGTLSITGSINSSATIAVSAGLLSTSGADKLANTAAVTVSGGTLTLGGNDTVGTLSMSSGTIGGSATLTANTYGLSGGTVTGNLGTGTINSSGTVALDGTAAATAVNVTAGTMTLGSSDRLADGATVTVSGGALALGSNNDMVSTFNLSSGSITGSGTLTATTYGLSGGTVTGNLGTGTINSSGTVALNGTAGATAVNVTAGTLTLGSSNRLADGATVTVSGGTLALGTRSDTVAAVVLTSGSITSSSGVLTSTAAYDMQAGTATSILGGTAGLTKSTAGTVTLDGTAANTYTGTTTINGGVLVLNKSGAGSENAIAAGSSIVINSGGTLRLGGQGQINDSNTSFSINGGTFDLQTFTEGVTSQIALTSGSIIGGNTGFVLARGGYAGTGTNTISKRISVRASDLNSGLFSITSGTTTVSGVIHSDDGSTAGISKTGAGTLVLSGASTYTGVTTVSAGVLNIQNADALGTTAAGTSVTSGAALEIQGSITTANEALNLSGTGVSSGGALRNISGTNSYAGLVTLGSDTRINSDSGTLTLSNTGTLTGSGFGLTVGGAGNTTINSIIGTTSGTLTKDGTGTLTLAGANTYTGATAVSAGTLSISGSINSSATLSISGGTLSTTGADKLSNTAAVTVSGGTLTVGGADQVGTLTMSSGTIGGSSTLTATTYALSGGTVTGNLGTGTINSSGTVALNGTAGATAVNVTAGTMTLGASAALNSAATLVMSGGGLTLGASNQIADSVAVGISNSASVLSLGAFNETVGTLTLSAANATNLVTGTGTLTATTYNITGSSSSSGQDPLFASTLSLGTGTLNSSGTWSLLSTSAASAVNVSSGFMRLGGNNLLSDSATVTVSAGVISLGSQTDTVGTFNMSGGFFGSGSGKLTAATYNLTGGTLAGNLGAGSATVTSGTVTYSSGGSLDDTSTLTVSSGTLALTTFSDTVAAVTLTGGSITSTTGTLSSTSAYDMQSGSVSAILGGTVGLTKTTAGTVTLSGVNSFSGKTVVEAGTVSISSISATAGANQSLGTNAAVDLGVATTSSGTLVYTGAAGTLAKNINALGNGSDTVQNSGSGLLTLSGTLTKSGTVLTLKGGSNGITVSGVIAGNTGSPNSDLVIDGGTVTLTNANTYNGPTFIRNSGTLNANVTNALPTANGRTAVTFDGTGTSVLTLGADQSVASLTATGAATVTLNANTLTVGTSSGTTTFAGAIGGTGGLIKDGASTLILSGTNGYTGATTLNAGNLIISGSIGSSTLTTINGGTLLGTGTVGAIQLNSGGVLTPGGASTAGTLSTGNLAIVDGQLVFNLGGTSSYSKLNTTGSINLTAGGTGAKLVLNAISGYAATLGDSFTLVSNNLTNTISGAFAKGTFGGTKVVTLTGVDYVEGLLGSGYYGRIAYNSGAGKDLVLKVVTPVMTITQSGTGVTAGGTYSFGSVDKLVPAVPLTKTFTIQNTGEVDLMGIVVNSPTGAAASDYSIDLTGTASTLPPGSSTTFTVTFNPSRVGTRAAAIAIDSNDLTNNPFNIILTGVGSIARNVTDGWTVAYAGPDAPGTLRNGMAKAVAVQKSTTSDTAVAVFATGYTSSASGGQDIYTAKYNPVTGALLWAKTFNGAANLNDQGSAIVVDSSGNVVITGYTTKTATDADVYVAKYASADGALLWQKTYAGAGGNLDAGVSVAVDASDNVAVAGYGFGATGGMDFFAARYSSDGSTTYFEKLIDGGSNRTDSASSVAVNSAGDLAVAGYIRNSANNMDFKVMKLDAAAGTTLWQYTFNGSSNTDDGAYAVAFNAADEVIATGYARAFNYDLYTVKLSGSGVLVWQNQWNGPFDSSDTAYQLAIDSNSDVIVGGTSYRAAGVQDGYVVKYSGVNGSIVWDRRFNGPAGLQDLITSVAIDKLNNVVATGYSQNAAGNYDVLTAKMLADDGGLLWEQRYDGSAGKDDSGASVAVSPDGNVFVAGYATEASGTTDFLVKNYQSNTATVQAAQTITFANPGAQNANVPLTLAASSSSGLTVRFTVVSGSATFDSSSNTLLNFTGSGSVTVRASQSGSAVFAAATPVDQTFTVGKVAQTISFVLPASLNSTAQWPLTGVATSGLAVTYNVQSGPGSITGGVLSFSGAGDVTVRASQAGDGRFNAATDVDAVVTSQNHTPVVIFDNIAENWRDTYAGSGAGVGNDIALQLSGNDAVAGFVAGYTTTASTGKDLYLAKYLADGTLVWSVASGTAGDAEALSAVVDGNGDVVIAGYVTGTGRDLYVAKYNGSTGSKIWEYTYSGTGSGNDVGVSLALDGTTNVVVGGYAVGSGTSNDFFAAKLNLTTGALVWASVRNRTGATSDVPAKVAVGTDGSVALAGATNSDAWTVKLAAADGTLVWQIVYNFLNKPDAVRGLALDAANNVIIAAYSQGSNYDIYTAKYASLDGTLIWGKRYNSSFNSSDHPWDLAVDEDSNVYVTGASYRAASIRDGMTLKYAGLDGTLMWEGRYNGTSSANDENFTIALDGIGNPVISGYTTNSNGTTDVYLAKHNKGPGTIRWQNTFDGANNKNDSIQKVRVDPNGNVWMAGSATGADGKLVILVLRHMPTP